MQPVEVRHHKPRPESRCSPFTGIMINLGSTLFEPARGSKEVTVMLEVVYTHFKAHVGKLFPQLRRNSIASFGNKVKRGPESELCLQSGKRTAVCQTRAALHVVCQHKCNFLPAGQPGQFAGGRSDPSMIGHTSPMRLRKREARFRRTAVRIDCGTNGFKP